MTDAQVIAGFVALRQLREATLEATTAKRARIMAQPIADSQELEEKASFTAASVVPAPSLPPVAVGITGAEEKAPIAKSATVKPCKLSRPALRDKASRARPARAAHGARRLALRRPKQTLKHRRRSWRRFARNW